MSEITEFEEARRRRRRKKNIRRMSRLAVVFAIVFVLAGIGFVGYKLGWMTYFSNLTASLQSGDGYPVSLDQQEVDQLIAVKGGVAVASEGSITVYNTKGVVTGSFQHGYINPVSTYSGGRLLTYDVGGTGWMVTNKTKLLQSGTDSHILLGAAINDKGVLALSRRSEAYLSEVTVYNTRGEEMFLLGSTDCYVSTLALDDAGKHLAAGGVEASGGALSASVKLHDMTGKRAPVSITLPESVLLSLRFVGEGDLLILTNRAVLRYDQTGKLLAETAFAEAPVAFACTETGGLYVAVGDYREPEGITLTAYDSALQAVGSCRLERRLLSLHWEEERLFILTDGQLLLADAALAEVNDRHQEDIQNIAPWGSAYYAVTGEGLTREGL